MPPFSILAKGAETVALPKHPDFAAEGGAQRRIRSGSAPDRVRRRFAKPATAGAPRMSVYLRSGVSPDSAGSRSSAPTAGKCASHVRPRTSSSALRVSPVIAVDVYSLDDPAPSRHDGTPGRSPSTSRCLPRPRRRRGGGERLPRLAVARFSASWRPDGEMVFDFVERLAAPVFAPRTPR